MLYKLSVNVTQETAAILKAEAKRLGCGMGTVISILALDKKKTDDALGMLTLYRQAAEDEKNGPRE